MMAFSENNITRYEAPEVEILVISAEDILTSSPGTLAPTVDEGDGDWGII